MLPDTTSRVEAATHPDINRRIRRQTDATVRYFAARPHEIGRRLKELDEEWNIERALEANASALALAGTSLALVTRNRAWLALPFAVTTFLLQHAVQGWCPPLPVLRRLGFRTAREINEERAALKAMRGDFAGVSQRGDGAAATSALQAARQ